MYSTINFVYIRSKY